MQQQLRFRFKIALVDITPSVWRRIEVPAAAATFFDLHVAIQDVMGWTDSHLHHFRFQKGLLSKFLNTIAIPYLFDDFGPIVDETTEPLKDWFPMVAKRCVYTYDLGDNWEHVVTFEGLVLADGDDSGPVCHGGANATPPEDSGGRGSYADLLKVVNRDTKAGREARDIMGVLPGDTYDPSHFDIDDLTFHDPLKRLAEYIRGETETR